ncbi:diphosphomevalonate decarboxylase, partial [Kappamyces sp. JEL0680]
LGIEHKPLPASGGSSEKMNPMLEMRESLPNEFQLFIKDLARAPSIREFCQTHPEPLEEFNRACLGLKAFRDLHIQIATHYILLQRKAASATGTGGTDLLPFLKQVRQETTDTVITRPKDVDPSAEHVCQFAEPIMTKNKRHEVKEVTCSAPVNIAVIKYWGKRDTQLMLPTNSSLSLTLSQDDLRSTTTIRASPAFPTPDCLWLNGIKQDSKAKRLLNVISQARSARKDMEKNDKSLEALSSWPLVIASVNNFPTAAGLASSASGFACLTFALAELYELTLDMPEISRIARMGSGSACRSLFGGYVKWEMGREADGQDSM